MDSASLKSFNQNISEKLTDDSLQLIMHKNTNTYNQKYSIGVKQFDDLKACKERISFLKTKSINNLDKYLLEFESKFIRNGGAVYWADTADDVIRILLELLPADRSLIVKSKSMATEEVDFNLHFQERGDEVIETDLGEFIVQQMGQKPSHITAPALHLSREQIASFLSTRFGIDSQSTAEEITAFVRKLLRTKFFTAGVGVSGANFLVADTGSVAITENEGNASLVTAWPQKHVVIAGIEKVIPSIKDLYLLWPMLATHATGQRLSAYNHIISGPARSAELDGPSEMYVILINNNRHRLLDDIGLRQSLNCIRCGACASVCPVFRRLTGHSYHSVYSGPIGSVITPHLQPDNSLFHLSFASTLCGACTGQCPSNIPLHELLLYNRSIAVVQKEIPAREARIVKMLLKRLRSRKNMDFWGPKIKNIAFKIVMRKSWLRHRSAVNFSSQSFNKEMTAKTEK